MAQFSTNEAVSLQKTVDDVKRLKKTDVTSIEATYEVNRCVKWITDNNYQRVCLQFPDYMLPDSCKVSELIQGSVGRTVYIMGDSNYESCCVDYITARHVDADAIIHFGPRCSSRWTEEIPCLCVYDKSDLDVDSFVTAIRKEFSSKTIQLVTDKPYAHHNEQIRKSLDDYTLDGTNSNDPIVYLGENDRNFVNFQLNNIKRQIYLYDSNCLRKIDENVTVLKRRRYLIEKIKDANTFGIVIGTLVVENFLKAIERVKKLLKLNGKKYYTLSVGRPNVAKLANFPEMDVYILICCPTSNIFESRDFYKPIVTLHDVETALNRADGEPTNFNYGIDEDILNSAIAADGAGPDVSLLSGAIRFRHGTIEESDEDGKEVAKKVGTVAVSDRSGAGFLANRSFRGLEQDFDRTKVEAAKEGRKGIAQSYDNELF